MRAFQFNLQRVLNYRETVEDALLAELGAIAHEHEREIGRLERIRAAHASFCDRMKETLVQDDPDSIRQAHGYLALLSERIADQEQVVEQIARRKDEKTAEVVEASKDRQILDRLKEIKASEHRREMLGEEQRFLDDLASVRHRANMSL